MKTDPLARNLLGVPLRAFCVLAGISIFGIAPASAANWCVYDMRDPIRILWQDSVYELKMSQTGLKVSGSIKKLGVGQEVVALGRASGTVGIGQTLNITIDWLPPTDGGLAEINAVDNDGRGVNNTGDDAAHTGFRVFSFLTPPKCMSFHVFVPWFKINHEGPRKFSISYVPRTDGPMPGFWQIYRNDTLYKTVVMPAVPPLAVFPDPIPYRYPDKWHVCYVGMEPNQRSCSYPQTPMDPLDAKLRERARPRQGPTVEPSHTDVSRPPK